jgi:hypothetical protein
MKILSEKERIKETRAFGYPLNIEVGKPEKHLKMENKPIQWRKLRRRIK